MEGLLHHSIRRNLNVAKKGLYYQFIPKIVLVESLVSFAMLFKETLKAGISKVLNKCVPNANGQNKVFFLS